ncbi:MAG: DUF3341 domain-containing protein [Labilibaculum sp.]|nr:DUF3341 domain-containing protein [Labilibaculum sp.]MBI9056328.1 DUF3341 domain-containing protein [Labilibaculum sp.]
MRRYISAYFEDEQNLLRATKDLRDQELSIQDVLTPFPVHGLDHALGYKRSNLPTVAFVCGAIGLVLAFGFQTWAFTVDYPLFIGGKPHFAIPSFIPITFELTVLFAAFGMATAFFISSKLGPGANNVIHDERITDDRFVIIVDLDEDGNHEATIKSILEKEDAKNIQVKEIEK